MASPLSPSHPLTPPAEPTNSASQPTTAFAQSQNTLQSPQQQASSTPAALPAFPNTSLSDTGKAKRPRDARLLHLLLTSHGIHAYQERVPLQLMDFAYRYTSSVLADAVYIMNEGYHVADGGVSAAGAARGKGAKAGVGAGAGPSAGAGSSKAAAAAAAGAAIEEGEVSMSALRMAIAGRMSYAAQSSGTGYGGASGGGIPKEFLKSLAEERNRIGLATGLRDRRGEPLAASGTGNTELSGPTVAGVKLPHEKYCLTGVGWGLREAWESEGEESVEDDDENAMEDVHQNNGNLNNEGDVNGNPNGDAMNVDAAMEDDEFDDEDVEGGGNMEDVFGATTADGDDQEMHD